ncbi:MULTISPECIES: hypothetical protein [unclassified Leeuwenhoekiella]|uniref:hypothetical protein n=1 Tax=unclassified Leeuwenhoekiella TaxID=2615029 RepID=UPI000C4E3F12|nr:MULTISPECIES: hypothetical protein [unclassified Leeuwenhoekiella]MAW95574.1 hypothetical protein [Leeuwenhoekiella sp.]MBA82334.1 hypothetical protein [Leeuwenhoekiella sp.]|tara:strand:- start:2323 stop:2676 length:354 start_codon:yes stop_codon:yes gene_type:complete
MKTFKTMVLAVAIICGTALNANTTEPTSKTTSKAVKVEMKKELAAHLAMPDFEVNNDTTVMVSFTVNDDNEMVVISVDSKDASIKRFIQGRLNYKKFETKPIVGQTYHVPVTLEASK